MKITSQKTPPRPATLDSVTLTMTPREAFCLAMLVGNLTSDQIVKFTNREGYSVNMKFGDGRANGSINENEAVELTELFTEIRNAFNI